MTTRTEQEIRLKLLELLRKQAELLEARTEGRTTDTDIMAYELSQEVIRDLCRQLANSSAA